MLEYLFREWPDLEISLLVFRDKLEPVRTFAVKNGKADKLAVLREIEYDGGTDLAALPAAMKQAQNTQAWLMFTDGLDTLSGERAGLRRAERERRGQPDRGAPRAAAAGVRELGGQMLDLQRLNPGAAAKAVVRPAPRLAAIRGSGIADAQGSARRERAR